MRGTDRALDVLHRIYETTIRWIFSGRRYRVFFPPLPAYGRPFSVDGQRDKAAPRRLRFMTITPRGLVTMAGVASFVVAIVLAPLVGSEFIPDSDNSFIQMNVELPVGTSLSRASDKLAQVEQVVRQFTEVNMISTTIGDTGNGSRNLASLSVRLSKPAQRKRTQKQVEEAPARGAEADSGHRRDGSATSRSTSPCWAPIRRCSRRRC